MKYINNLFRKIFGWIVLIIGAFGWLIPIPLVPFFLLFFIGLHILNYDTKLLNFLKKRGFNTDKFEKYLQKAKKKEKEFIEPENTKDPQ